MKQLTEVVSLPSGAHLVANNNMAPTIPIGSLVFLHDEGFIGEGIYSFPFQGEHCGDLRRVSNRGVHRWALSHDGTPKTNTRIELTTEDMKGDPPRQVVGVVKPLVADFERFLSNRFGGVS
jgi:hypothetical protein